MRKKQLLRQNTALFEQATASELMCKDLEKKLAERDAQIDALKEQIALLNAKTVPTPFETLKKRVETTATLPSEVTMGAKVIGKTVVEAAKCCNALTADPDSADQNVKELVNLILGRTEVAKAEILKLVSADLPYDEKCRQMERQFSDAQDYFASMMAQKI